MGYQQMMAQSLMGAGQPGSVATATPAATTTSGAVDGFGNPVAAAASSAPVRNSMASLWGNNPFSPQTLMGEGWTPQAGVPNHGMYGNGYNNGMNYNPHYGWNNNQYLTNGGQNGGIGASNGTAASGFGEANGVGSSY